MAVAVTGGVCTPKKAGQRRCGGASPRTPTSRAAAASPRTPGSGGSASTRTPSSGAAARRRHSGTPKMLKPFLSPKTWSSCPRSWAPMCALRVGGKGSPLRRARTGSDTSSGQKKVPQKKLVAMISYKSRTPAETRALPLPRVHSRVGATNKISQPSKGHDNKFGLEFNEVSVADDHQSSQALDTSALERRPLKFVARGGKPYGHGKKQRYLRLQKQLERGVLNG